MFVYMDLSWKLYFEVSWVSCSIFQIFRKFSRTSFLLFYHEVLHVLITNIRDIMNTRDMINNSAILIVCTISSSVTELVDRCNFLWILSNVYDNDIGKHFGDAKGSWCCGEERAVGICVWVHSILYFMILWIAILTSPVNFHRNQYKLYDSDRGFCECRMANVSQCAILLSRMAVGMNKRRKNDWGIDYPNRLIHQCVFAGVILRSCRVCHPHHIWTLYVVDCVFVSCALFEAIVAHRVRNYVHGNGYTYSEILGYDWKNQCLEFVTFLTFWNGRIWFPSL